MSQFPDAAPSFEASFNDTRCTDGSGVCPTDPLLFTCRGTELSALQVTVPTDGGGDENLVLSSTNTVVGVPPPGITVVATNATQNSLSSYDYEISLSIQNASLLYGGPILCDGGTPAGQAMASCSLIGKYEWFLNYPLC